MVQGMTPISTAASYRRGWSEHTPSRMLEPVSTELVDCYSPDTFVLTSVVLSLGQASHFTVSLRFEHRRHAFEEA